MSWLIHRGDATKPGSPRILLAQHNKPVDFPSHVFGLTALEGLQKASGKRVLSSRQHTVSGIDVTDIEVEARAGSKTRTQWRRLFVHQGLAYTLTYSADKSAAEQRRAEAETVRGSLRISGGPPAQP